MKAKEEIKAEIEKLKQLKNELPEYSKFGTPNWKVIDAQIFVLTNPGVITQDDIWDRYEHLGDEAMSEILAAIDFIEGNIDSLTEIE